MLESLIVTLTNNVIDRTATALLDAGESRLRAWLGREPARLAFQTALLRAITRFANDHPDWAAALLDETFFTRDEVAAELSRFLTRRDRPDPARLATAWATQLPDVGEQHREQATAALADFLHALEDELSQQDALQPLFDSRALERIAANTEALRDLLETTLHNLQTAWDGARTLFAGGKISVEGNVLGSVLVSGHHNVVYQTVLTHYPALEDYIYDFSDVVDELTRHFVGREFLLAEGEAFMSTYDRGIFRLVADAGLGKSAVAAVWARYFKAPIFFFGPRGSTSPARCLQHLCAELIGRYALEHTHLPARAGEDGNFLKTLLRKAHAKSGRPVVLVIDALDEAEGVAHGYWLPLPEPLPKGTYIMVTHRPGEYPLPGHYERTFILTWDAPHQQVDIERYLRAQARRLAPILEAASVETEAFVSTLKQKSEGNFMYLTYVIQDIEHREPGFHPLRLEGLPQGLRGYYELFWNQMERSKTQEGYAAWRDLYKPTLALLAAAAEPVTVAWLADLVGQDAEEILERVLLPWQRFLRRERRGEERWSIIHQSFADFVAEKVDRAAYHRRIADYYLADPARWTTHGGYAFRHLTHHLAQADDLDRLGALIENHAWYTASKAHDPSRLLFAADVERALAMVEVLVVKEKRLEYLPHIVAWSLLHATVRTLATNVPVEALEALVLLGNADRALRYATLITDPKKRAEAFWRIGEHLHTRGEADAARQALRQALAAAQAIRDEWSRARALGSVAQALAQAGDREGLRQALAAAQAITGKWSRARALGSVAQALAQMCEVHNGDVAGWLVGAFQQARARGREEMWQYIRAFAPVLGELGVITETWRRIQAVEAVVRGPSSA